MPRTIRNHPGRAVPTRISISRVLVLAAVAATSIATAAQANLLTNGSFETPGGNYAQIFTGGEPTGFGWSVTTGNVETMGNSFWSPHPLTAYDGTQLLDLVGVGTSGGISQSFATTAGDVYEVTFAYANNSGSGPSASAGVTVVDGVTTLLSTLVTHSTTTADSFNWTIADMTFVASGSSATLSFLDTSHLDGGGIYLDAVSVTDAPEPVSLAVFGVGLAGVGLIRRRRAR